jgi:hypothetical protein
MKIMRNGKGGLDFILRQVRFRVIRVLLVQLLLLVVEASIKIYNEHQAMK